jgi:uncharacterized cupredoxin-like copper-binding protein
MHSRTRTRFSQAALPPVGARRTRKGIPSQKLFVASIFVGLVWLVACGGQDATGPAADQTTEPRAQAAIRVAASEYSYSMPTQVAGGVVTFEMMNEGRELHEFGLARLEEGRTVDDLLAAIRKGEQPEWLEGLAGVPILSPGHSATLTTQLPGEGSYVFVCFLPSPQGAPHINLGMVASFEVKGDIEEEPPVADAAIVARDDGLEVPAIQPGRQTLELMNEGENDHEFWLVAYEPGKTDMDVGAWLEGGQKGPAPATFVGGVQAIPPGTSVFVQVELRAGVTYVVEDFANGLRAELTPG